MLHGARVLFQPCGVFSFGAFAGGKGEGLDDGIRLAGKEAAAVPFQETDAEHEPRALVSVKKRVILYDASRVARGQSRQGRLAVDENVFRPGERGLE